MWNLWSRVQDAGGVEEPPDVAAQHTQHKHAGHRCRLRWVISSTIFCFRCKRVILFTKRSRVRGFQFLRRIESWWSSVWQDASNRRHGKIDKPLQDTNIGSGKTLTCHPSTSPNLHCGQKRWLWVAKILDQESVRVKSLPYVGNLSYFQISWEVQRPIFDIRVINSRSFFANWT